MQQKTTTQSASQHKRLPEPFQGFEPLNANFLYCPNQFFDVCLWHCSRGAVRFIAYLIRRTLGWVDANGNPIEENITVSHQEFIDEAGISKGAIDSVADEVVALGFAWCTQEGKPKSKASPGQNAAYKLRWDERGDYVTDLNAFQGFFAGGGNVTRIPNAFFDYIVPKNRLSVIKVVGTVLRHTVGFVEGKYGGRRKQAELSVSFIQKYANIKDRKIALRALNDSRAENFIHRVQEGSVHRTAVYAPKWLHQPTNETIGSKNPPATNRFKKPTRIGSKNLPENRFKKPTTRKTDKKNTDKQQAPVVAVENMQAYLLLHGAGFYEHAATELSKTRSAEEIQQQIAWLPLRKASKNPLGMLRRAIEGDWSEPESVEDVEQQVRVREREERQQAKQAAKEAIEADAERTKQERRHNLLKAWQKASEQEHSKWIDDAIEHAPNQVVQANIRTRSGDRSNPPREALEAMALDLAVPIGESP